MSFKMTLVDTLLIENQKFLKFVLSFSIVHSCIHRESNATVMCGLGKPADLYPKKNACNGSLFNWQGVRGVSGRVSQRALGRRGGRQGNAQKAGPEKEKYHEQQQSPLLRYFGIKYTVGRDVVVKGMLKRQAQRKRKNCGTATESSVVLFWN
jgi:hypothetical protein